MGSRASAVYSVAGVFMSSLGRVRLRVRARVRTGVRVRSRVAPNYEGSVCVTLKPNPHGHCVR